jgi:hypothetical protein
MVTAKKKAAKTTTASQEAVADPTTKEAAQVAIGAYHKVKNISDKLINTSKSSIQPGEEGLASHAECNQLGKWLEKI